MLLTIFIAPIFMLTGNIKMLTENVSTLENFPVNIFYFQHFYAQRVHFMNIVNIFFLLLTFFLCLSIVNIFLLLLLTFFLNACVCKKC